MAITAEKSVYGRFTMLALFAALAGCARPAPVPARPNVLLITVDTLRADHLSCYGYQRATTPRLDRLAADSLRMDRAIVQWPKTGPSMASIFTSTYPKDNGIVRHNRIPVPADMRLLAEELRDLGYATRAVVANGALSSEFGYDQGFERYVESWRNPPPDDADGTPSLDPDGATRVTDLALEQLGELAEERRSAGKEVRPYFLWVHYLDPHFPYVPPPAYRDRFQHDDYWDGTVQVDVAKNAPTRQMTGIGFKQVLDHHRELDFYVARYDAEIAYTDAEIGRLLDGVAAHHLDAKTLTVVGADHGESLGEHYFYFDHGRFAFQASSRVPLIVHFPGVVKPGVDPEPVELIDLAPTVLEIAGAPLHGGTWGEGRSFVPRLRGDDDEQGHVAFTEAGHADHRRWQRAVQDRRFKLVLARDARESQWLPGREITLFDLVDDPGETADASAGHPEDRQRLEKAMRKWLRTVPKAPLGEGQPEQIPEQNIDQQTVKQLRALGYLD